MSTTLRSDDKVSVVKTTGNNKPEYYPISELNELISSEEDGRLTTLEGQVGNYDPEATESTITSDLESLQEDVQTETTGLMDRTAVLEEQVGDYDPDETGSTITADLEALQGEVETETTGLLDRTSALEAIYPELGVPGVATQSTAVLRDGELDEITLTSVAYGEAENDYTINLIVPEVVNETRTIAMTGSVIDITVKTELDGETVIVSTTETATDIAAAISADETVGAVFQAALTGGGAVIGASDLGVIPTGGQDATIANAGQLFIDAANTTIYICIADTDGTETVLDANWQTIDTTAISS